MVVSTSVNQCFAVRLWRFVWGVGLTVCSLASPARASAPKVAVVFSDYWGGKQKTEFHYALDKLGWEDFTLFNNTQLGDLTARLDEFDMVLATTLANYENTWDFEAAGTTWRSWIDNGGGLLVVDANYTSVIDLWINRIFPEAPLTHAFCAPHIRKDIMLDTVAFAEGPTLLRIPQDVTAGLESLKRNWGHIESWGQGWIVLAACYDDKGRVLLRNHGRGAVLAMTYSGLRTVDRRRVTDEILGNFWTHLQSRHAGLTLTAFVLSGRRPGDHSLRVTWDGTEDLVDPQLVLQVTDDTGRRETKAVLEDGGADVPFHIASRGEVALQLILREGGTSLVEIPVVFTIPPPVTLVIEDPHAFPSRPYINVRCSFAPDADVALADCSASFRIADEEVERMRLEQAEGTRRISTVGLPVGTHTLTAALLGPDGDATRHGVVSVPIHVNGPRRFRHRTEDGTMLLDGKPILPIGFYNVSQTMDDFEDVLKSIGVAAELGADIWRGHGATAPDWERVRKDGWNWRHLDDNWRRILETAEKENVYVIPSFFTPEQITELFKGHPKVIGYYLADEPGVHGAMPETLHAKRDRMLQADPSLPTVMCLAWPHMYHVYARTCGVLANDPYPVTAKPKPMITVYDQLLDLRVNHAEKDGRATWAVPQAFGRPPEQGNWLLPNREQMRNMTWQALLAGCKGILYYALNETHFNIADHPGFKQIMKDTIAEVRRCEQIVMDGLPVVSEEARPVLIGAWSGEAGQLGVILNASHETQTVDVAVPSGFPADAPLPDALRIENGTLTGVLAPHQTVVVHR